MILLNTPLGDVAKGERGLAAVPGREADFRRDFDRAMAYAVDVGVPMIHVMAGVVDNADRDAAGAVLVRNVRAAADLAASHGIDVLLEPLNTEDTPGYFLTYTEETRQVIDAIERDNVRPAVRLLPPPDHGGESRDAASRRTSTSSATSSSRAFRGATSRSMAK